MFALGQTWSSPSAAACSMIESSQSTGPSGTSQPVVSSGAYSRTSSSHGLQNDVIVTSPGQSVSPDQVGHTTRQPLGSGLDLDVKVQPSLVPLEEFG